MKKILTLILGCSLLTLTGCSVNALEVDGEQIIQPISKMTDLLLDNTTFPNQQSKEQLESVINDVEELGEETIDSMCGATTEENIEKLAEVVGQIQDTDTPEISTDVNVNLSLQDTLLLKAIQLGYTIETEQTESGAIYTIKDENNTVIATVIKEIEK